LGFKAQQLGFETSNAGPAIARPAQQENCHLRRVYRSSLENWTEKKALSK
jgi:hypothetical protein